MVSGLHAVKINAINFSLIYPVGKMGENAFIRRIPEEIVIINQYCQRYYSADNRQNYAIWLRRKLEFYVTRSYVFTFWAILIHAAFRHQFNQLAPAAQLLKIISVLQFGYVDGNDGLIL